jgi:hypothetical protein
MVDRDRTAVTYRCECWRALSAGVIEAAGTIFLLLIAVRYYKAGPLAKAMVAGGGSLGLILAPWVVLCVEASGWPLAKAAGRLAASGAASFLVMALVPALPVYVGGCVLAMTTSSGPALRVCAACWRRWRRSISYPACRSMCWGGSASG